MGRKVYMKDIAARAGVSIVTVSKALSGYRGVSEKKRKEIEQIAMELGYVPPQERQKSARTGFCIAAVAQEQCCGEISGMRDSMFSILEEEAGSCECSLVRRVIPENGIEDESVVELFQGKEADGVIVLGDFELPARSSILEKSAVPVVFVSEHPIVQQDCVIADGFYGAYQLTRYLLERGHRKILYVSAADAKDCFRDRRAGFVCAMEEYGLPAGDVRHIEGGSFPDAFSEELKETTAFFCSSEMAAELLYKELEKHDIRCPEDVSIVSYDNSRLSETVGLNITSYDVNVRKIVRKALKTALRRINGGYFRQALHIVTGRLAEGGSVREI